MASPKTLINALHAHWEVVEHLVLAAREHAAFTPEQVLAILTRTGPERTLESREAALRQMIAADLLQVLPRDTLLQLHPLVLDFARGLTREHELGLSEVLQARVQAITQSSARLLEGLQSRDFDQLRQAGFQLAELFRQIAQQLDQDRHAILEIAERAKSADANLPIARRYREVLEAFDRYVEPMAEMMDTGPGGTFYRHLEAAEQALDHAVETLTVQGGLYGDRQNLRQVSFRVKELRRLGREVLKQCSDTLLPLREEIRQHDSLSGAVSLLLGRVRKRGLLATLRARDLPRWRRDQPRRISVSPAVGAWMAEALEYQPPTVGFPDDAAPVATFDLEYVDESALLAELKSAVPVNDLLIWLQQRFPNYSDSTLLRLYHALLVRHDWQLRIADQSTQRELQRLRVTYHAHALVDA
ncbi:MAG: hypothetical protein AB7E72_07450 [Lysobacterales bacterium]